MREPPLKNHRTHRAEEEGALLRCNRVRASSTPIHAAEERANGPQRHPGEVLEYNKGDFGGELWADPG